MEQDPVIISLSVNDAHLSNFVDLNKKRKLDDEQLGLPLPKHKFRDRSCCCDHEFPGTKHPYAKEIRYKCLQIQSESVVDSNSLIGESDCKIETGFSETCIYGQSPTSYSFTIDTSKNSFHSLESSTIRRAYGMDEATSADREPNPVSSEKGSQLEPGSPSSRDQLGAFGEDPNCILSEYENHGKGPCSEAEAEAEEMMLYSNGATSNMYVLSSGRWSVNKDAQPRGARKPTIDQEFEQYFSMLMLNN